MAANNDALTSLYNALSKAGISSEDLGGTEADFRKAMSDEGTRSQFYDWVKFAVPSFKIGSKENYMNRLGEVYSAKPTSNAATTPSASAETTPVETTPAENSAGTVAANNEFTIPETTLDTIQPTQVAKPKANQPLVMKPTVAEQGKAAEDFIHSLGTEKKGYSLPLVYDKEILQENDKKMGYDETKDIPTLSEYTTNVAPEERFSPSMARMVAHSPEARRAYEQQDAEIKKITEQENKLINDSKNLVDSIVNNVWEQSQVKTDKANRGEGNANLTDFGKIILSTTGNTALVAKASRDYDRTFKQIYKQIADVAASQESMDKINAFANSIGMSGAKYYQEVYVPMLQQQLYEKLVEMNMPVDKWDKALKQGLNNTIIGLIANAPKMWEDPVQASIEQDAMNKVKGNFGSELVGTMISLVGDMPVFGLAGSMASATTERVVVNTLAKKFVEKGIEREAARMLAKEATKKGALNLATHVVGGSANLAYFNGLHSLAEQVNRGEMDLSGMAKSMATGAALGGVLGITGAYTDTATRILNNSLGNVGDKLGSETIGRLVGESLGKGASLELSNHVMASMSSLEDILGLTPQGQEKSYHEHYMDAVKMNLGFLLIGGAKRVTKAAAEGKSVTEFMRELGSDGAIFSERDLEDLRDIGIDGSYYEVLKKLADYKYEDAPDYASVFREGAPALEGEELTDVRNTKSDVTPKEKRLVDLWSNSNLTNEQRDKILWLLTGEHLQMPETLAVGIHKEGKDYVVTGNNVPGIVNFRRYFINEQEAVAYKERVENAISNNNAIKHGMRNGFAGFIAESEKLADVLSKSIAKNGEDVDLLRDNIVEALRIQEFNPEGLSNKHIALIERIKKLAESDPNIAPMIENALGQYRVMTKLKEYAEEFGVDEKDMLKYASGSISWESLRKENPNMYDALNSLRVNLFDENGYNEQYDQAEFEREVDRNPMGVEPSPNESSYVTRIKDAMRAKYQGIKEAWKTFREGLSKQKPLSKSAEQTPFDPAETNDVKTQLVQYGASEEVRTIEQRLAEYEGAVLPPDVEEMLSNMEGTKVGTLLRQYAEGLMSLKNTVEAPINDAAESLRGKLADKSAIDENGMVTYITYKTSPTDPFVYDGIKVGGTDKVTYIIPKEGGEPISISNSNIEGIPEARMFDDVAKMWFAPENVVEGEAAQPVGETTVTETPQEQQEVSAEPTESVAETPTVIEEVQVAEQPKNEDAPASVTPDGLQLDGTGEPIIDDGTTPKSVANFYLDHPRKLGDNVIDALVKAKLEEARKAMEQANLAEEPQPGLNTNEYLDAYDAWKKAKDDASNAVKFWQDVQGEITKARGRNAGPSVGEGEVPDMTFDTPEAAYKRGYWMQNGVRYDMPTKLTERDDIVWGKETEITFAPGVKVKARYALVPVSAVIPSHINGAENPQFFPAKNRQPKDRTGLASSMAMNNIVNNLQPELLTKDNGTPYSGSSVVDTYGFTEQGNNRNGALTSMDDSKRRAVLESINPEEVGIPEDKIGELEDGYVLQRVITEDLPQDKLVELGQYTASSLESGGDDAINPVSTASLIQKQGKTAAFIDALLNDPDGGTSINGLIKRNGFDALRILNGNAINQTQFDNSVEGGRITDNARNLVEKLVNELFLGSATANMKNGYEELPERTQSALLWAFAQDNNAPTSTKILPEIRKALDAIGYAISKNRSDYFGNSKRNAIFDAVSYYADVVDSSVPTYSKFELELAARLAEMRGKDIQEMFDQYYSLTRAGQDDLFGGKSLTKEEAIEKLFGIKSNAEQTQQGNGSVVQSTEPSKSGRGTLPSSDNGGKQGITGEGGKANQGASNGVVGKQRVDDKGYTIGKPEELINYPNAVVDLTQTSLVKDGIKSLDDIKRLFDTLNGNATLKTLFYKVFDTTKLIGLDKVYLVDNIDGDKSITAQYSGVSDETTQKTTFSITFTRDGLARPVSNQVKANEALHELIHRTTAIALNYVRGVYKNYPNIFPNAVPEHVREGLINGAKKLQAIFELISKDESFKGFYGVYDTNGTMHKDAGEMVAELSKPSFREKLKEKDLWTDVTEAMAEMFDHEVEGTEKTNALVETEKALQMCLDAWNGRPMTESYLKPEQIDALGLPTNISMGAKKYVEKKTEDPSFESDYLKDLYDIAVAESKKAKKESLTERSFTYVKAPVFSSLLNDIHTDFSEGQGEKAIELLKSRIEFYDTKELKNGIDRAKWNIKTYAKTYGKELIDSQNEAIKIIQSELDRREPKVEETTKMGSVTEEKAKAEEKVNSILDRIKALQDKVEDKRNTKVDKTDDIAFVENLVDTRNVVEDSNNQLVELKKQLVDALAEYGYQIVREGTTNPDEWGKKMLDTFGETLKDVLKMDDAKVKSYLNDVRDYTVVPDEKGEIKTIADHLDAIKENSNGNLAEVSKERTTFVEEIANLLSSKLSSSLKGREVTRMNIPFLRGAAQQVGWSPRNDVQMQEAVEQAIITVGRKIAQHFKNDPKKAFEYITKLYEIQPTISMRDSNRIEKQQYSTPLPMSFVADMFASSKSPKSVLEPTAGNGMMVFAIDPAIVRANEIDPERLSILRQQGFGSVTDQNGMDSFEPKAYDAVVMNPPFGSAEPRMYGQSRITGLDPIITINALESMKDNGKAAIIVGRHMEFDEYGKFKGQHATMLRYLFQHYNVADVINMAGGLYSRQGTSYETKMILIDGRKPEGEIGVVPRIKDLNVNVVNNFDDLYGRVEKVLHNQDSKLGNNGEAPQMGNGISNAGSNSSAPQMPSGAEPERSGIEKPVVADNGVRGNGVEGLQQNQPNTSNLADTTGQTSGSQGNNGKSGLQGEPSVLPGSGLNGGRNEGNISGGSRTNGTPIRANADTSKPAERPVSSEGLEQKKPEAKVELDSTNVSYPQTSNSGRVDGCITPAGMAQSLTKVLKEFGDVDQFVADQLGFESKEDLFKHLNGPQIESVALAVKHMSEGHGMVIADQTGMGKGRQAASLVRWAVKQGKTPIYLTEATKNFYDVAMRDMGDIGMPELRPFIINAGDKEHDGSIYELPGGKGKKVHKVATPKQIEEATKIALETGKLPEGYDYFLVTYSQFNSGTKNYVEGKETSKDKVTAKDISGQKKRDLLTALMADNYIIMDESHNAAGSGQGGQFMTYYMPRTKGVTFLSATFAKRPDCLPLYAMKTAIGEANLKPADLIAAIEKGGPVLEELLSKQLAESGQIVRRERGMENVKHEWVTVPDKDGSMARAYDGSIELFRDIISFQRAFITPVVESMNEEGDASIDILKGTESLGVNNTPFASRVFNITRQLMLSLKADDIVNTIVEQVRRGQKPLVTLENTMEGAVDDLMALDEEMDAPDFAEVFRRGLASVFKIQEKDPDNPKNVIVSSIPLSDLSPEGREAYYALKDKMDAAFTGLPLSPIDHIILKLQEAGVRVAECTGRKNHLVAGEDGKVIWKARTSEEKNVGGNIFGFNNGDIDVIIGNATVATGVSMHASPTYKDQRQRTQINLQAMLDIAKFMQFQGRVNRLGQVVEPEIYELSCPIPAEQRNMMMLKGKLKSLSANTTSNQNDENNDVAVVDFLNKYGDRTIIQMLKDNPDLNERLFDPFNMESMDTESLEKFNNVEGAARKVSGKVSLLTAKEQEEFYNEVVRRYNDLVQQLKDAGEYDLEAEMMPLNAETKSSKIFVNGKNPGHGNVFADDSILETCEIDVLKKPMKAEDVRALMNNILDGKSPEIHKQDLWNAMQEQWEGDQKKLEEKIAKEKEEAEASIRQTLPGKLTKKYPDMTADEIEAQVNESVKVKTDLLNEKLEKGTKRLESTYEQAIHYIQVLPIGKGMNVAVKSKSDAIFNYPGMFLGFKQTGKKPIPSAIKGIFALNNGRRKIEVSLSDKANWETIIQGRANDFVASGMTLDNWDSMSVNSARKTAHIVTGNLLQGFGAIPNQAGQIIKYTTNTGEVKTGVLLPDNFDFASLRPQVSITLAEKPIQMGEQITDSTGDVTLYAGGGSIFMRVPKSKKAGGKYFMDDGLRKFMLNGVFDTRGNEMLGETPATNLKALLSYLDKEFGMTFPDKSGDIVDKRNAKSNIGNAYTDAEEIVRDVRNAKDENKSYKNSKTKDLLLNLQSSIKNKDYEAIRELGRRLCKEGNDALLQTKSAAKFGEIRTPVQAELTIFLGASNRYFEAAAGRERTYKEECRILEQFAKDSNNWIDEEEYTKGLEKVPGGVESSVYFDNENNKFVKFTDFWIHDSKTKPSEHLCDVAQFNSLFLGAPIEILGISRKKNGALTFVTAQQNLGERTLYDAIGIKDYGHNFNSIKNPDIRADIRTKAFSIIENYMRDCFGFNPIYDRNKYNTTDYQRGEVTARDLHGANIVVEDGYEIQGTFEDYYHIAVIDSNVEGENRKLSDFILLDANSNIPKKNNLGDAYADAEEIVNRIKNSNAAKDEDLNGVDDALRDVRYSKREKPAPKNQGTGYKVFFLKDGKLYPPMVANPNGSATEVGVWLDADAAPISYVTKTGRNQVKAGGKGTQGGSGQLSYRPGWHLGEIPFAFQFNRGEKVPNSLGIKNADGEVILVGKYFPKNFVWAEVKYANDIDYQKKAMSYGYNKSGNFQHSLAGLPELPVDGSYKYRTNANPATDPWIITGAMKVNKILTPSEVDEMVSNAGREPQEREEGFVTDKEIIELNKSLGLDKPEPEDPNDGGGKKVYDKTNPWDIAEEVLRDVRNSRDVDTGLRLSTNPEVRVMAAENRKVREAYDERLTSEIHQQAEVWRDYAHSIETAQDLIEKEIGRKLTDYENVHNAIFPMFSKNDVEINDFNEYYYKPIMEEAAKMFVKNGTTLDDLEDYMIAKSGLERNEVLAKRDADKELPKAFEKSKADLTAKLDDYKDKLAKLSAIPAPTPSEKSWITKYQNLISALTSYIGTSKHKAEVEKRLIAKYRRKDYSGLTSLTGEAKVKNAEAIASDMVSTFESNSNTTKFWDAIKAATGKSLEKAWESGQMSEDTYKRISSMMEYYTPLRGWRDEIAEDVYSYENEMRKGINGVLKNAKGRRSLAESPLAVIGTMGETAVIQGNRNRLFQKVLNLAQNTRTDLLSVNGLYVRRDPITNTWQAVFPELKGGESQAEVDQIYRDFKADMEANIANDPDNFANATDRRNIPYRIGKKQIPEHQLVVYRDGKPYVITVNGNPRFAKALKGEMSHSTANTAVYRLINSLTRAMSKTFTTYSPQFMLNNPFRDLQTSTLNNAIREDGGYAAKFFGRWFANVVKMPFLYHKYNTGNLGNGTTEKYFAEFVKNGGQTGFGQSFGVKAKRMEIESTYYKYTGKHIKHPMTELERKNAVKRNLWYLKRGWVNTAEVLHKMRLGYVLKPIEFLGAFMEDANKCMENVTRFSTYMESRMAGKTIAQAIKDAKEITGNYNMHGAGAAMANETTASPITKLSAHTSQFLFATMPFINAGIQSADTTFRQNWTKERKNKLIAALGTCIGLGVAGYFITKMLAGDEDFKDIPEYERRNKFIIPIGDKEYIGVPIGYQFRSFYAIGDIAGEMIDGKANKSASDYSKELTHALVSALPVYFLQGDAMDENSNMLGSALYNVGVPGVAKPLYGVMANRKWNGAPIYKEMPYNEEAPEYMKVFKTTDKDLVELSKALYYGTREDRLGEKGSVNINPAVMEYLFESYFGGPFKEIMRDKRFVESLMSDEPMKKRNYPIVGNFFREIDPTRTRPSVAKDYYKYRDRAERIKNDLKELPKEDIEKYKSSPEFKWYNKWHAFEGQLKILQRAYKAKQSPEMQKKLDNMMERMNAMSKRELGY